MTVHTRASDELPGQSDEFPGPPDSDRAWEQVSIPDSSGNPISSLFLGGFADDGNRAIYAIFGGTDVSTTGSIQSLHFAERSPSRMADEQHNPSPRPAGRRFWLGRRRHPRTSRLRGHSQRGRRSGLRAVQTYGGIGPGAAPADACQETSRGANRSLDAIGLSAGHATACSLLERSALDPDYPAAAAKHEPLRPPTPRRRSWSACSPASAQPLPGPAAPGTNIASRWFPADGSFAPSSKPGPSLPASPAPVARPAQLYLRDLGCRADRARLRAGCSRAPIAGARLIETTATAAYFVTASRLDPDDAEPATAT